MKSGKEKAIYVTILVHGTKHSALLPPYIDGKYKDPINNLLYGKLGLNHVSNCDPKTYFVKLANTLSESDSDNFQINNFYLFGWSGRLSQKYRSDAAKELRKAILELYNKPNPPTHLRIITHSHGGNVALHLAEALKKDKGIQIDELILLACPVQKRTENLVKSPSFRKIFSLYSDGDFLQIIDPQGLHGLLYDLGHTKWDIDSLKALAQKTAKKTLLSARQFPHSENLVQIKLVMNNHNPLHLGFLLLKFARALPKILYGKNYNTPHAAINVLIGEKIKIDDLN